MQNKRELGQYYTRENPFNHPLFKQWMVETGYSEDDTILEVMTNLTGDINTSNVEVKDVTLLMKKIHE